MYVSVCVRVSVCGTVFESQIKSVLCQSNSKSSSMEIVNYENVAYNVSKGNIVSQVTNTNTLWIKCVYLCMSWITDFI